MLNWIRMLVLALLLTSCASSEKKSLPQSNFKIINLGSSLKEFWQEAQNKPFIEQVDLWDKIIESPHQHFYDALVWRKTGSRDWHERKIKRLREVFETYVRTYPEIEKQFSVFPHTLDVQVAKFQRVFPDAKFDIVVYAVPSPTFNGRGSEGPETGFKETILAFGIDTSVSRGDDPDVLFSHELFHIYHGHAMDLAHQGSHPKLSLPLWMEGLATYVSQNMNPKASKAAILMDADLAKVNDSKIPWLARQFLSEIELRDFDSKNSGTYKKWFNTNDQYTLREDLPSRCGYLLGLKVVEELSKKYSLFELTHWKPEEVHTEVIRTLQDFAKMSEQ